MRRALAIRHVAFEDLGLLEPLLVRHGFQVRYLEATVDDLGALKALEPDLLIVLGGPIGAYDEAYFPFIEDELILLERRLIADRPTLGICLGSQLMARSLGARVYSGAQKEIGWSALELTPAGQASPLRHLAPPRTQVLHWHGDTFDLPEGAKRLASTPLYENQAFSWGLNGLALQFHPEVTEKGLEAWFVGHFAEISMTPEVSVDQLRHQTAEWARHLASSSTPLFDEWLRQLVF